MALRSSISPTRSRIAVAALATTLALDVSLVAGCPSGRSSDVIVGFIEVEMDQKLVPLAQADVTIRPVEAAEDAKKPDEAPELTSVLSGVSVTNGAGTFEIGLLASNETFAEYPLLRGWVYEFRIQAPGYYIYRGKFTFEGGATSLGVKLDEKSLDVMDDTGVIDVPDGAITTGAVRRGT